MSGATRRSGVALLLAGTLLLAACGAGAENDSGGTGAAGSPSASSGEPSPSDSAPPSPTPSTEPTPSPSTGASAESPPPNADARIRPVPRSHWRRVVAVGAWRPGCPVTRRDLREVRVNHWTFSGEVRRGTLVVNRDVAASLARIFTRLYDAKFPIRRMRPVTAYRGDSNASLRDDNTSAYNCRRPGQTNAPVAESPHANGRAIDINPRENPWKDLRCRCWSPGPRHHVRSPGPGKILKGGLVWRAFRKEGWIWQDIDVPDYMHFDTGYPSRPFRPGKR